MSSIAEGEIIRYEHGPLPSAIFSYEAALAEGKKHPTPTKVMNYVEYGGEVVIEHFDQVLDEKGRVVETYVDDKPFLKRKWSGDVACTDELPDGVTREIVEEYISSTQSCYVLTGLESKPISIWHEALEADEKRSAAIEIGVSLRDVTHTARLLPDNRMQTEYEWLPYDYEDGFFPQYRSRWNFDNEGSLQSVITPGRGMSANSMFQYPLVERYQRIGEKAISVVKYFSPEADENPLIGMQQHREYDSEGRVVAIRSQVCIPDSSMQKANIEISYN